MVKILLQWKNLTKKPRKHANSVSFKNHSMRWHQRRVLLLVTVRFTFSVKKNIVITVRTRKQKKDTSVTEILVNVDKPRSKTQTQMHLLRWVNLLRKHHSERSDFSNLTNENPRPSTFLKQDSNNNLQSRYLSYSRHSCCSGSLELHLHVTGVKDYICIHVKNIHIQEPACYGMTFKLRTDPRGTITTFCANTKPKYPSRRCEKQQQKHKLRLTEHLISVNKGNRIHFIARVI